jgi:hypothetical protein
VTFWDFASEHPYALCVCVWLISWLLAAVSANALKSFGVKTIERVHKRGLDAAQGKGESKDV